MMLLKKRRGALRDRIFSEEGSPPFFKKIWRVTLTVISGTVLELWLCQKLEDIIC